jgi:purine-cytosine permease-like protein
MKNKLEMILILLVGMLIGQVLIQRVGAFGETTGPWTMSEKRQVIELLQKIAGER